jgi:hypothetical protein
LQFIAEDKAVELKDQNIIEASKGPVKIPGHQKTVVAVGVSEKSGRKTHQAIGPEFP